MPQFPDGTRMNALEMQRLAGAIPASYTVFKLGTTFYAECNIPGGTDYSGSDAATVINQAVTALSSGGVVALRENTTFDLSTDILLNQARVGLVGMGRSTFLDGDALATDHHAIKITAADCFVSNLAVQTEDGGGKTSECIYIDNAARFLVDRVQFIASDDSGVHVTATLPYSHGIIRDSWFEGACDFRAIWVDSEQNVIHGCQFNGDAVELSDGSNAVSGCSFRSTYIVGYGADYSTIVGNKFFYSHIDMDSSSHMTITGNGLNNGRIRVLNNCVVSGNLIRAPTDIAIYVGGTYSLVSGNNIVDGAGQLGISLVNANYSVVKGNLVDGSTTGIRLSASDNCVVANNTMRSCTVAGLDLISTSDNTWVRGNDLRTNTDDVTNQGTGTIWTNNLDRNGGFHEADAPDV